MDIIEYNTILCYLNSIFPLYMINVNIYSAGHNNKTITLPYGETNHSGEYEYNIP